jgi:hypothetical protein
MFRQENWCGLDLGLLAHLAGITNIFISNGGTGAFFLIWNLPGSGSGSASPSQGVSEKILVVLSLFQCPGIEESGGYCTEKQ